MAGINTATGQTFSNVDSILKEFYLGPVREQLEYASPLSYRIQKDQESVGGRQVVIPLHIGKNESFTGVSDGGYLPDPGAQSWTTTTFPVKYHYGRLLITGPTIAAAKTDKMAFLRTLDAAIKGLTRDMKKEMNRVYHGNGSGILNATLTTPGASSVDTFDVANTWDADSTNKVQFLRAGMTVGLVATSGASSSTKDSATVIGGGTIASVDPTAATQNVVFEDTVTVGTDPGWGASATYYLVRASRLDSAKATTYAQTSWFKEAMGIKGIIDDGNPTAAADFQGIDASTAANSFWRATVDSTTTALSFSALQQMFDSIAKKCEGDRPTAMMTDYTQRRKYFELWENPTGSGNNPAASRRYVNVRKLDGGFEAVEYNGVPILVDVDSTPGHLYFMHEPSMAQFMNEDYFWLDRDGKILHRLEDKDAYQATLARYFELGCYRRNTQGVMDALAE